jgi:hypothetical protein
MNPAFSRRKRRSNDPGEFKSNAVISDIESVHDHPAVRSVIDRIVRKISKMDLPDAEHFGATCVTSGE